MRIKIILASTIVLLASRAATAQVDVVAHVKADLVARGVSLAGTCGAFEVTKRVAWTLRGAGWRLLAKSAGDNCHGFSGDKLVSSRGQFVDILIDQGGANTPAWQERPATAEELAAGVDPGDPGDVVILPGPPPAPLPTLAIDYDRIAALVKADGDQTRAKVDEPGWFTKVFGNPYVQMALAAVGTCVSTQCWQPKK